MQKTIPKLCCWAHVLKKNQIRKWQSLSGCEWRQISFARKQLDKIAGFLRDSRNNPKSGFACCAIILSALKRGANYSHAIKYYDWLVYICALADTEVFALEKGSVPRRRRSSSFCCLMDSPDGRGTTSTHKNKKEEVWCASHTNQWADTPANAGSIMSSPGAPEGRKAENWVVNCSCLAGIPSPTFYPSPRKVMKDDSYRFLILLLWTFQSKELPASPKDTDSMQFPRRSAHYICIYVFIANLSSYLSASKCFYFLNHGAQIQLLATKCH